MNGIYVLILLNYVCIVISDPQNPEINDQYEANTTTDEVRLTSTKTTTTIQSTETDEAEQPKKTTIKETYNRPNFIQNLFKVLSVPLTQIIEIPKINNVLRNVGTCIVNGVMEIVTYYLPSPFIPLIASAAGMMIPFEPIITLRRRMPVTSYRRAFKTALNGFINTFDRFKPDSYDDDPYMTRRFNRRFNNDDSKEKNKDL